MSIVELESGLYIFLSPYKAALVNTIVECVGFDSLTTILALYYLRSVLKGLVIKNTYNKVQFESCLRSLAAAFAA